MERVFNWMLLNLLWLLTSLPVLTVGASTAALIDVTRRMEQGEDPAVFREYFRAWVRHARQATLVWIAVLAAVLWLLLALQVCFASGSALLLPVAVAEGALLLAVVLSLPYGFALCLQPETRFREIVKTAMITALRRLPWSVALAVTGILPWAVTLLFPGAFPFLFLFLFWLFAGVSAIAFVQQKILNRMDGHTSAVHPEADAQK